MPSKKPLFSDLVRDSKIETESLGSYIRHVFHEAGRSVGERLVRREERWVRQKYLGQGTYGTVYLEKSEDGAGDRLRAVKEVKKFVVLGQELDYARELEAIMKFSHPRYKHCFVSSKGWYELEDSVFITMEFLELGDLQRYLTQPLPESEGKQITEQILEGLGFMHDNGFIHRDLKPANVMVVAKAPKWFVKIADFGISKRRQQEVTTMLTLQRGTLGFAAPEALGAVPDNSYTFSVDMWSLGAVAYRILTNTTAFQSLSELFQYAHGMLQFPEAQLKACAVSEQGQAFIMNLMQPRPDARLSAAAAASHSWITTHLPNSTNNNEESFPAEAIISEPADNTGVSVASKAWSNESTTIVLAESTALPVSRSNYQPPSVSDCLDEPERHENFILPADSRVVLDEAIINTDDQSSAANDYTSVQEEAELSQETIRLNPRPSSIANKENEEIHQGENHETNSSSEQNSPSDPKIGGTFAGSAAKSETAAQDDTDLWGSWGIGKKKKKTITEEDPWGIFSTWKKKMKKTTIPDDDPRGVWGQPKRKENNPNNAESGNGNNILQERDHENDNRPGASNSNSDKDAGTVGCQRHSIPSKQPHDTSAENSFDPAVNNKNNTKASEPRPVAPDRKQPKEPATPGISVRCNNCHSSHLFPNGPVEYLRCKHFMCHSCLLELLALALVSPKFLSPRCCESPEGEISGKSWGRLILDPRINAAWDKYRRLNLLNPYDNWRCPRGHPPQGGSVLVTTGSIPIWKQVVHCSRCLTSTINAGSRIGNTTSGRLRPTKFCLFCSGQMDTNECKKCDYDSIVWQFALRLQERGIVTGQISKKLDKADRVRGDMRNGKGLDYQTLRELNRPELTTMTESEYTDSASANSDNERGHPLNYPPPGRFQNQAPSKVRFAKPYGPEDVQYSGYYPRSNAPRPTEPPRYRDVTCSWCSAEHRKPMNVHSDVLGPYDTCRKCGIILICQDCRRPITKSFLCECPTFQGNNTSYAAPKAENRRVSPISDEDDHRSDIRNRRNDGPSNSRAHRRDGGNKAQKAAMASLIAGATEAFRTRNEPAGGRTKRVLAAAAGAAAADNLITRDTGSAYSYSDRESSYDDDSDYQKTRPYAPKDTSDRLAHFSGETTPGAKLRGMRSRDIETWRHSL